MSNYHANCKVPQDQPDKKSRTKPPLTTKPFCDCKVCPCRDCPDILKLLRITVTGNSCDFGSKVTEDSHRTEENGRCSGCELEKRHSLLEVMNQDKDCNCEIMARAVRSNVHMNMGMSERREATNQFKTPTPSHTSTTAPD